MKQKKWREEDLKAGAGQGQTALGAGGLFGGYRGRLTPAGEQPEKAQGARVWTARDIAQLRDGPSGDRPVREPGGFTLPRAETKSLERAGLSKGGAAWRPDSIGTALRPRPQAAAAPLRWDSAPYGQGATGERKGPYLREEQKNILRNRLYDKGFTSSLAEEALAVLEDTRQSPDILFGKAERPGGSKPAEGQEDLSKSTSARLWKEDVSSRGEEDRTELPEELRQLPPAVIREGKRWHHPESQINQEFSEEVWRDVMKDVDGIFEELGLEKGPKNTMKTINDIYGVASRRRSEAFFIDQMITWGPALEAFFSSPTWADGLVNALSAYAGTITGEPSLEETWGEQQYRKRMQSMIPVVEKYDFLQQSEYGYLVDNQKKREAFIKRLEELLEDKNLFTLTAEGKMVWYAEQWVKAVERIIDLNINYDFYKSKRKKVFEEFDSYASRPYTKEQEKRVNQIREKLDVLYRPYNDFD